MFTRDFAVEVALPVETGAATLGGIRFTIADPPGI